MRVLKRILLGLVGSAALLVAVGLLLPSSVRVERSAVIGRRPATVFALVDSLEELNRWSPWADLDPTTRYTFEGPRSGVGAKMIWDSDHPTVGSGSQEIVASERNARVRTRLDFGRRGRATASFQLDPVEEGTRITWGFDTDFGWNLPRRYFGLAFDRLLGADLEKGLAKLQALAESLAEAPQIEIALVEVEPYDIVYLPGRCEFQEPAVAAALGAAFERLSGFLQARGLEPAGAPLAITTDLDRERGIWSFEAAIPVDLGEGDVGAGGGEVRAGRTYGGKAVRAIHVGPYRSLVKTYDVADSFLEGRGLEVAGRSWEQYLSDPGTVPEQELVTHVYFPVR